MSDIRKLLLEGGIDALGFLVGTLSGYGVGLALGWDIFSAGYGSASIAAILLVGLGGGGGVQLARRLFARHKNAK